MTTEKSTYAPREGSVAWRVIEFLTTNPDEALSNDDVMVKFDAARASVHTLLAPAVAAGVLKRRENPEDGELVYQLDKGTPAVTATPGRLPVLSGRSPFGQQPAPSRKRFWIDTTTVAIEQGVPLHRGPAAIDWPHLFGRMSPTDSCLLPIQAATAISKAMTLYQRAHPGTKFTKITQPDGVRVWRLK